MSHCGNTGEHSQELFTTLNHGEVSKILQEGVFKRIITFTFMLLSRRSMRAGGFYDLANPDIEVTLFFLNMFSMQI